MQNELKKVKQSSVLDYEPPIHVKFAELQLRIETQRPHRARVHDDRRVNEMLKGLVRQSKNAEVRKTSAYWLGHIGGEHAFLSELVRNERADKELREAAAHAVGMSRDRLCANLTAPAR